MKTRSSSRHDRALTLPQPSWHKAAGNEADMQNAPLFVHLPADGASYGLPQQAQC
ncbi:hypothetical protein VAWG006_13630 [Aeromonas enteropelogenes]|nr:hypothetical protein VAWG006_13630 [Aeromonas enteropelogenes]